MRTLDPTFAGRIATRQTSLCRIVSIELLNGAVLRYTDSDTDVHIDGFDYLAALGAQISQIRTVLGLAAQSCTVDVLMGPGGVTAELIESGALDNAKVRVSVADFGNPYLPGVPFLVGFVSKVDYKDRLTASIECMPLVARAVSLATEKFSINCRADLGDGRCKVDLSSRLRATTLAAVTSLGRVTVADHTGGWADGLLAFGSGPNAGFSFEVADSDGSGLVILKGIMPYVPAVGDAVTLYPGCNKTIDSCKRYGNLVNYRGEPYTIPTFYIKQVVAPAAAPAPKPKPKKPAPQSDDYIRVGGVIGSFGGGTRFV